ncbi:hypothetical protein [Chitinophaga solisilvae]|uniref:hypothetical protein n=1 Tax=Chitinophaga solisilvae TaxID=1233460 RepID=UPI001370E518|nr:hypothetical protein [Chitinophaga solisilvae]
MKQLIVLVSLMIAGSTGSYAQTYKGPVSTNATYLATIKGISFTYSKGTVTVKNNGAYNLAEIRIAITSETDKDLYGIALFEDGLNKGETLQQKVYFTHDETEVPLKDIDEKKLVITIDKAVRAK